jgi:hypothetical protein
VRRDEDALPPTYLAMGFRRQFSDEHVYEPSDHTTACGRCGRRRSHPDHCDRDTDKNAVKAIRERMA